MSCDLIKKYAFGDFFLSSGSQDKKSAKSQIQQTLRFFFYPRNPTVFIPPLKLLSHYIIIKLEDWVTGGPFGALKAPL